MPFLHVISVFYSMASKGSGLWTGWVYLYRRKGREHKEREHSLGIPTATSNHINFPKGPRYDGAHWASIVIGVGRGLWKVYLAFPSVMVITSLQPQNAQGQGNGWGMFQMILNDTRRPFDICKTAVSLATLTMAVISFITHTPVRVLWTFTIAPQRMDYFLSPR